MYDQIKSGDLVKIRQYMNDTPAFAPDYYGRCELRLEPGEVFFIVDSDWHAPISWGDDAYDHYYLVLARGKVVALSKTYVDLV